MKRISKAKRAFLLAVVRDNVCVRCRCAPGSPWHLGPTACVPCYLKWLDEGAETSAWL